MNYGTAVKRSGWARGLRAAILLLASLAQLGSMGCSPAATSYVHPNVDLGFIRRCAVLPFENMSADGHADERMQTLFTMTVLDKGVVEVMEPGAVADAMAELRLPPGGTLTPAQYVSLGQKLSVDGLFFGSIEDYGLMRRNREQVNQVTAAFGLVETQTGTTVWRAQIHLTGSSFWGRLLGGGSRSMHEVSTEAVNTALGTLF